MVSSRGTKYWNMGAIPLISPEVLTQIVASASDMAVVISDVGTVISVMGNPDTIGPHSPEHWEGHDIREFLAPDSIPKLDAQLAEFVAGGELASAVELNHTDGGDWEILVRYSMHPIASDGTVLMLGRDMRTIADMQQQLVRAQMALERDYEAQRKSDTQFRVLMEANADAIVFVSVANGRINDLNSAAAALLGAPPEDLQGSAFAQEFESRRRGEFMTSLSAAAVAEQAAPVELTARRSRKKLKITPLVFRAAGERMLMCRLETAGEADASTEDATSSLVRFFREGVDAIVFTDRDGIIQTANEAFLSLSDSALLSEVKGKPLADYLSRGAVDAKVLIDNAARNGHMRLYATRVVSAFGGQTTVEISATYLADQLHPAIAFVIRDASRAEALRKPGLAVSDEGVRNVMELVGSATLKDIVNETTEVVEKMCIETAVELTRNNRVAAAEMLGLSRQSLYVKLRKYGLLSKGGD